MSHQIVRSPAGWMPAAFFALALLVLKWHLIWRYGNATPFWDQWDAEAANLYLPWISGQMGIADWLRAHNEHRILMPRILLVALFELNGRECPGGHSKCSTYGHPNCSTLAEVI